MTLSPDDAVDCIPGWLPPPAGLEADPAAVHLWRARLDLAPDDLHRMACTLAPDESARAGRINFSRGRDRFVAGRGILRTVLGRYLSQEPEQVLLHCNPYGKPYVASSPAGMRLSFNVAHSGDLALIAIAFGREVGVDVEYLRPLQDAEAIAEGCFSEQEREALRAMPDAQRQAGFFVTWTRKEAWLKAMAVGLCGGLSRFAASQAQGRADRWLKAAQNPAEMARWSLVSFSPAPGSIAALAVEGHGWHLACWDYSQSRRE